MPSPALQTLRGQRLPEVQALLAARPPSASLQVAARTTAQAINRAGVVLLTAHLEGFVEDLVVDMIDELNKAQPSTGRIPKVLLAAHVIEELTTIAKMTDPQARADRIERLFRGQASLWLDYTLKSGSLKSAPVTATLGNPGAKEIARILALLGMGNVFSQVQLPDGGDPEKRINEIVGIRNAIAHGGGPAVGDQQIDSYAASVDAVAASLEREAAAHLQAISGISTLPWP